MKRCICAGVLGPLPVLSLAMALGLACGSDPANSGAAGGNGQTSGGEEGGSGGTGGRRGGGSPSETPVAGAGGAGGAAGSGESRGEMGGGGGGGSAGEGEPPSPVDPGPAAGGGGGGNMGPVDAGGGEGAPDAGPGAAPTEATVCINADGPGGQDTYALLESILGMNCIENPDADHTPPFRHVKEETDDEVGHHFAFHVHRNDSDMGRDNNKNRLELKVHVGAHDALKGTEGEIMTYTWRFKMDANMVYSPRFNAMFQIKSLGGNAGLPLINIKVQPNSGGQRLLVEYIGDGNGSPRIIGSAPLAGLKGVWLQVLCRVDIRDNGSVYMTIKKPDGSTVITVDEKGVDMWRQGQYLRPKWGLYRGKESNTRDVEIVRFANFGITAGPTPSQTCIP